MNQTNRNSIVMNARNMVRRLRRVAPACLGVLTLVLPGSVDAASGHNSGVPQTASNVDPERLPPPLTVFAQTSFDEMVADQRARPEAAPMASPFMEGPGPQVIPFPEGANIPIVEPTYPETPVKDLERGAAAFAPPIGTSFQGVIDDGCWIPPDTMGAAGPNHIVEILNSGFTVYNKAGGVVQAQRNLGSQGCGVTAQVFFGALGMGVGQPANDVFDPKIVYDQYAGRWVVTADANANNRAGGGKTWVLVGISQTNDPTGN